MRNSYLDILRLPWVRIPALFLAWVMVFALARLLFCVVYGLPALTVLPHGVAMDCSMAGYLTALPAVLLAVEGWLGSRRWLRVVMKIWSTIAAVAISAVVVLDLVLYGYWGFRLDASPIFYFLTSPASAMASAPWWQALIGLIAIAALAFGLYKLQNMLMLSGLNSRRRWADSVIGLLLAGALFIPIRGGVTVSTMNLSRAYFSSDPRLNHGAVNPAFSLMYSLSHQSGFEHQFRLMEDGRATQIVNRPHHQGEPLLDSRPDIYLFILESFSNHLFPSLGGAPVATRLDSIAATGTLFTDFYASGFRTDRGIPAILSALPTQPTVSLMKYVDKAEKLPSLAAELKRQGGYSAEYWYGGDANFTNMLAYLVSGGYDPIVRDADFPVADRLSKWGAHDDVLLDKLAATVGRPAGKPRFVTVQTSTSHEPFQVPGQRRWFDNDRQNAFAFTDNEVADFLNILKQRSPRPWLAILVADHYGAWPLRDSLPDQADRHRVPLIIVGEGIPAQRIATVGSQVDIAPTLLEGILGLDGSMFPFGRNLLALPREEGLAWLADPDQVAILGANGRRATFNIQTETPEAGSDPTLLPTVKAWLQHLYTYIGSL